MDTLKKIVKNIAPGIVGLYHRVLPHLGALIHRNPSDKIFVVGVTGTKGKSSTTEFVNAILEEAGYSTALLNSIRVKIGHRSDPNHMRMSMPGRFYIQRFLKHAVQAGCTAAILEMTSEGARQFRHRAIHLDALIFTNLAPEHLESHGSYAAYANAKLEIGRQLERSSKRPRMMIANALDQESRRYMELQVEKAVSFSLNEHFPYAADENGGHFTLGTNDILVHQPGQFSLQNALGAATLAEAMGIAPYIIARGIGKISKIAGRAERIEEGQNFAVVIDYAHTPDSLKALYHAYAAKKKVCVLGATGGGRDTWKRPVMGQMASRECAHVILTNEDPYNEDPNVIIQQLMRDMNREPEVILDRRAAIRHALELAGPGDVVLITGKGTDPTIQGPRGTNIPWSDAEVAREELRKMKAHSAHVKV